MDLAIHLADRGESEDLATVALSCNIYGFNFRMISLRAMMS